MALESAAAAQEDFLIPGLNFKLPQSASYVSGRRFATFFPQGSNIYTPNGGTRLIRFVLSDAQNMLDLSTFRLAFELTNTDGARLLWPQGHPGQCWFQRVRIYIGGTLIEDILLANRVSGMLDLLKPANRRWSESLELLGSVGEDVAGSGQTAGYTAGPMNAQLGAGSKRTIVSPIFAGLFATHYLLPGRFPLTIELELVNNPNQCCAAQTWGGGDPEVPVALSQTFEITNARILCDVVSVDNAVNEELSRVLLAGGALPLHLTSYSNTMHNLILTGNANQSFSVTLSRAFSRIKSIFVTFDNDGSRGYYMTESNNFLNWHGKADYRLYGGTNVYNPALGEGWRFQLQAGALLFPDIPMSSTREAWYQLSKLLGHHASLDGVSIPPGEWQASSFVIGLDMEKAATAPGSGNAAFTGMSTRNAGDTLRFAFDAVNCRDDLSRPSRMYITLHMDLVVELRAEGVVLLD